LVGDPEVITEALIGKISVAPILCKRGQFRSLLPPYPPLR
jgi:hypothetical protein